MKAGHSHSLSLEKRWELLFEELKAFRLAHGHCNVPNDRASCRLRDWVKRQRAAWCVGRLPKHRFDRLQQISFPWTLPDATGWDERYRELQAYQKRFGNCDVPKGWSENARLSHWVSLQRTLKRRGTLHSDRFERLQQIGFSWQLHEYSDWEQRYLELRAFKERFGNCDVPARWPENVPLGRWVACQREWKRCGRLRDPERIARLDEIGFGWVAPVRAHRHALGSASGVPVHGQKVYGQIWENTFTELQEFHRAHGHLNLAGHPAARRLRRWMARQRRNQRRGALSETRVRQLEQIGFSWMYRQNPLWEEHYRELLAYKDRFGHCNVPARWPENVPLGRWVACQRAWKRQGLLRDPDRLARLDALGFDWGTPVRRQEYREQTWQETFTKLQEFHHAHGHLNLAGHPAATSLRKWMARQREAQRLGTLPESHFRQLEQISFSWKHRHYPAWEEHYRELLAYKERFGHCNVPARWPENVPLGRWVACQRAWRRQGILTDASRCARLDALGFDWESQAQRR